MIKFKSIEIEGFGSILGPFSYGLDSPGINLIKGKNGVGKTTIFSALTWVLYGTTLKHNGEITPWPIITNKDFEGTKVTTYLKNGLEDIKITRCKDFKGKVEGSKGANRILLYINDVYQEHLRDKKDVQRHIEDMLGISFKLFKNSLVFGQKLTRLLAEEGKEQKLLFDEAFEASFINIARDKAKKDREELDLEFKEKKATYEVHKTSYNTWSRSIKGTKALWYTQQAEFIKDLKLRLEQAENLKRAAKEDREEYNKLKAEDKKLRDRLDILYPSLERYNKLDRKFFKIDLKLGQLVAEERALSVKRTELIRKKSSKIRTCPVCGGPLDEAKFKELQEGYTKEFKETSELLKKKGEKINKITSRHKKIKSSLTSIDIQRKEYNNLANQLDRIEIDGFENITYRPGIVAKYQNEVKELKHALGLKEKEKPNIVEFVAKRKEAKEQLLKIKPDYLAIRQKIKLYDWLINEPLSNTGLKAYIFNSMLTSVNKRLQDYSKYIGFTIQLHIDLESGRKNFQAMIYKKKCTVNYEDLSGGQQQLADVCLAFAIHDVTASNRFNILVMDEVFESLDEDNIELVMEMILFKAAKTSIHLITHIQSTFAWKIAKEITLESRSGVTNPIS